MAEETKKEEEVKVPKSFIEEMNRKLAEMQKTQEMLIEVADKKQLARFWGQNTTQIPKEVKLRVIDGKVIVGWKTIKNEVFKDGRTGVWQEIQDLSVVFEDGTTEEMSLVDFNRKYTHIKCRRIGSIVDEATGNTRVKLESIDTGKVYEVGVEFVN